MHGLSGANNMVVFFPPEDSLEKLFPNLAASGWCLSSERCPIYNCIAFGLHIKDEWWEANGNPGHYWPSDIEQAETIKSWIEVYGLHGFCVCDSSELKLDTEKVAFYVKDGEPQHVARQLDDGRWISKLGRREDIEHNTLHALEGDEYGTVEVVMKRQRGKNESNRSDQ